PDPGSLVGCTVNRALSTRKFCTLSHPCESVTPRGAIGGNKAHAPISDFEMYTVPTSAKLNSRLLGLTMFADIRQRFLRDSVKRLFNPRRHSPHAAVFDELNLYICSIFLLDQLLDGSHNSPIVQNWRPNSID